MVDALERGGIPSSAQTGLGAVGKNASPDAGLPFIDLRIHAEVDIAREDVRKALIEEILGQGGLLRKEEHRKRARVYKDGTKQYAMQLIRKEMEVTTLAEMENRTPNISIAKKIINKKARVYLDSPLRVVDEEAVKTTKKEPGKPVEVSPDQKFLDDFTDVLNLDHFMKKVNRGLELHRNILVAPRPVSCEDEPGKFDIELESFSPEYYDVVADSETGRKPLIIIFSYFAYSQNDVGEPTYRAGQSITQATAGSKNEKNNAPDRHFVFWSRTFHFVTDQKGIVIYANSPDVVDPGTRLPMNPLGRLPFVVICKDQDGSFWSEGGEDLIDNSILINLLMADLYYIAKYQGMGTLFMTGKEVPKNIAVGPGRIIGAPYNKDEDPEPKLTAISAQAPVAEHLTMIEQLLAFTLSTNDLEPGSIMGKLENPKMANSGIQEIIQKSEISTAIEDEQEIFRIKEPEIVEIALAWLKLYKEKSLLSEDFAELIPPADADLDYVLTFDSTAPFVNEKDHIDTLIVKKSSGLFTMAELVAMAHPDLDTEQIKEKIAELEKEKPAPPVVPAVPPKPGEPVPPAPPIPEVKPNA